jgi:STE24 endopeptidase
MPTVVVPKEAEASADFNAERATEAYLAEIPPAARTRSDAYFEGGYWLMLYDFLAAVGIALLLLNLRWSAAMRNAAERATRFKPVQSAIYWVEYIIVASALGFPLTWYEGFVREHRYGLATQSFLPWLADQGKAVLVAIVLGAIAMPILFGIIRRLVRTWWIWGALVASLFAASVIMIAPLFIFPLFNRITRLEAPRITTPILRLARANGIPAREVFEIDASRQTTRMSANVSGLGSTMRITLNDNLLHRGSPEEIQAVMGHEMGHYVLHHSYWGTLFAAVVMTTFFAFLRWALGWTLALWGERWQIRDVGDTAVVPLAVLLGLIFFFFLMPVTNAVTRTQEHEADMYGLNASREPDGFAQAAIHLGEYRKMSPGTLEEWIFFDHPSGRHRIHDAMVWKEENLKALKTEGAMPQQD